MKLTIKTQSEVTIEVPKYFRTEMNPNNYYMTVGNESAIQVVDYTFSEGLILYPSIKGMALRFIPFIESGLTEISEEEYKNAFISVSVELEKMMN